MGVKIIFAAGGTGGHLFPAQGLAEQMLKKRPEIALIFAGEKLTHNVHFDHTRFSCRDIRSTTPFRGNVFKAFTSIGTLLRGIFESLSLIAETKPALVIGFGSFHAFPILCAAVIRKIPIILFESNCIPGKVIRFFSKRAQFTGIYFQETQHHLKGKTIEVEIPIKESRSQMLQAEARHRLGLHPNLLTLLAFGGSQGAKQINKLVIEVLPRLKKEISFQLIHLTGDEAVADEVNLLCASLKIPCYSKKFETCMQIVWSAADLTICRSGAMTLSELLYYEVPALLIPYPFAADQHQWKNARFLEEKIKGAIHCLEPSVSAPLLSEKILPLARLSSQEKLNMKNAIKAFKAQQKKEDLSHLIIKILDKQMKDKYHFIGIGGIGMSALAHILLQRGVKVSGSDVAASDVTKQLQNQGAEIFIGHSVQNIHPSAVVVYSSDIKEENPELQRAKLHGMPFLHRSELLFQLMKEYSPLLVTGTHGKTTTSSLLVHLLVNSGLDPTYAVGGIVRNLNANAGHGAGPYFVAEADESDGSFLNYIPFGAIITNIDNDHLAHWSTVDNLINGFKKFAHLVQSPHHLVWCGDDETLRSLKLKGFSYGFNEENDLQIENFRQEGWRNIFDISFEGIEYSEIEIPLIGGHNVLNAAAVFGLGIKIDIPEDKIRKAFAHFQGVNRRTELKGQCRGIAVFDDYAHHPTEIFATSRAIKQAIGHRRLVVAFQPHRYTRTHDCLHEFGSAFERADILIVTDIYAAREAPIEGVTNETLLSKIREKIFDARYIPRSQLSLFLANFLQKDDVLVTMGAGDITEVGAEVLKLLTR